MSTEAVDPELAKIAFDRVPGSAFEDFVNAFYPSVAGENFIPLGGLHDGGADGFQGSSLWSGESTDIFYQASTEENHRSKITNTMSRLRDFGRTVNTLVYITSRIVKHIDIEEQKLGTTLSCIIRIRDRAYLLSHLNDSISTRAAFRSYLAPHLHFLRKIGGSALLPKSKHVSSPAVYVFLRQEFERRGGKDSLEVSLTDGLILWALEGTDPENGNLMSVDDVTSRIERELPAASRLVSRIVPRRLQSLSKIPKSEGRPIRWYKRENKYCLSHEIRARLETENAAEESLRVEVLDILHGRITEELGDDSDPKLVSNGRDAAIAAVQRTFETEGLELAAFIEGETSKLDLPTVSDCVFRYI